MNEKKRLLKNTGLIALGNMGAKVTSFILLPMYTSILSTEEYGTYDYIVALCAFLLPVVTICVHEAMFRFIIEYKDDKSKFSQIVSHAFITVISGVLLLCLVTWILNAVHPILYCGYVLIYLIAGILYTFSVNLLRGKGEMRAYALISSCKNILQIVFNVIAVAVLRSGFNGLIISMCISEVLAFIATGIRCKLWECISFRNLSKTTMREMLTYSLPLVPDSVCAQIINISDRMIISNTIGAGANGIYSISYKFPNIIETVFHYFYTAWSESASRVVETGKERANIYYQSLYHLIDRVMFSAILLLTAGMPLLFRVFVRGNYISGFNYVPVLMFAMYFDCLGKFYSGVFTAFKETKVMATSTFVAAVVNVLINILFIAKWGLFAAAISTLAADFLMVEIRRHYIKKFVKIQLNIKMVILELCMVTVVCLLYDYDNWIMTGLSILIAFSYSIMLNRTLIQGVMRTIRKKFWKG